MLVFGNVISQESATEGLNYSLIGLWRADSALTADFNSQTINVSRQRARKLMLDNYHFSCSVIRTYGISLNGAGFTWRLGLSSLLSYDFWGALQIRGIMCR